jgi:hypothetical protein
MLSTLIRSTSVSTVCMRSKITQVHPFQVKDTSMIPLLKIHSLCQINWSLIHCSLILPFLVNLPPLLILLLTPPRPLWRLIDPILLLLISLLLRLMHASRQMLSGRIHRNQLQRLISLGNKLMLRSRWHDNHVARTDFLIDARDRRETAARCEEQDLVDEMDLSGSFSFRTIHHLHPQRLS